MVRIICVILTSRAHYSRMKPLLEEIKNDSDFKLQIVLGGSAISDKYGDISKELEKDGFEIDYRILMIIEGGSPITMAKTTAVGLMEFSTAFDNLKPDLVVVRGDRFEMMAPVISAAYMNIPIAHIEGGDVTGTIDESVRHAISKFAHIHFPTNKDSYGRLLKMGEDPKKVFDVGSLDVEFIVKNKDLVQNAPTQIFNEDYSVKGIGPKLDLNGKYLVVLFHPVTTEYGKGKEHMKNIVDSIYELKIPTIFFWPNLDAGNDEISKEIRQFIDNQDPEFIHFFRNLRPEDFLALVNNSACLVGNSSTGIKECAYLGTPVVNIGTRQNGRLRAENVIDCSYEKEEIIKSIKSQIENGKYNSSDIYGSGNTAFKIKNILKEVSLDVQKRITY